MSKCQYDLRYDINRDMWNWRGATEDIFSGVDFMGDSNWKNARFIEDDEGREIAQKIGKLDQAEAEKILKPYLEKGLKNPKSRINQFMKEAEKDFAEKFNAACDILEKITGHPMVTDKFTFSVTTFPRMPYFLDTYEIFVFDSTEEFWGQPIDGFMHEALHFQFTKYWGNREDIAKLDDDRFDFIKEALTVVLDKDLQPILTVPDKGYDNQKEYRAILTEHWQENHDWEALINYGLKNLEEYYKAYQEKLSA